MDVINGKLMLYIAAIGQVFKMSPAFAKFISSSETSRFLFSFRDLAGGFSGYYRSLSGGLYRFQLTGAISLFGRRL